MNRSANEVRLVRGTVGLDPRGLRPGADLVIDVAPEHGLSLPDGVALDDHLDHASRLAVDARGRQRLAAWRASSAARLTVDRIDLTQIWELELLAECFLPAASIHTALGRGLSALRPRRLVASGLDAGTLAVVSAVASGHGVEVVVDGSRGGAPPPMQSGRHRPVVRALRALLTTTGLPPRTRGNVLCLPYWPLSPVYARMATERGRTSPVPYGLALAGPGIPRRATAAALIFGGWAGYAGAVARERSRRELRPLLVAMAKAPPVEPLERAEHALAIEMLSTRALETLAEVRHARRAFRGGRLRAVVLPVDSAEVQRGVVAAAHEAGAATLVVQHGFDQELGDPDKTLARHVAVWSERDRSAVARRSAASITVTGNPGADHLVGRRRSARLRQRRALVLVEYPARISVRVEARIGLRHVAVALRGLASARAGTTVVIRPHPTDRLPNGTYERLGAEHPDLRVEVDATTPIERLFEPADLCIGALSTATLQAAVAGVPTIYLDVTGARRPWPFDGAADGLPRARSLEQLESLIASTDGLEGEVAGREAAIEALGVSAEAVDRTAALVASLVVEEH